MSKCHLCGTPDTGTVLIKCQWFGRGTKWLCIDCVRSASARPADRLPATRPRSAPPMGARAGSLDAPAKLGRDLP